MLSRVFIDNQKQITPRIPNDADRGICQRNDLRLIYIYTQSLCAPVRSKILNKYLLTTDLRSIGIFDLRFLFTNRSQLRLGGAWSDQREISSCRVARNDPTGYGQSRLRNRELEQTHLNRCTSLQGATAGCTCVRARNCARFRHVGLTQ